MGLLRNKWKIFRGIGVGKKGLGDYRGIVDVIFLNRGNNFCFFGFEKFN